MRHQVSWLTLAVLAGCGEDPVKAPPAPVSIAQVGTASGTPGWLVDDAIAMKVVDDRGDPVEGLEVSWETFEDGAWLGAESSETDADGIARVDFAPGWKVGTQQVRASSSGLEGEATVAVSTLTLTSVTANHQACGLDPAGAVWCWFPKQDQMVEDDPVRVPAHARPFRADPTHRYSQIAVVDAHTNTEFCGLTDAHELRCWQLPEDAWENPPAQITSVAVNTPAPFATLAVGSIGSGAPGPFCALDVDGGAWCRGYNQRGELGDGTTTPRDDFQPVSGSVRFKTLRANDTSFCGLDQDDHAWCWGADFGTPVLVPTRMGGDNQYSDLAFSYWSACGIATTDRKLYCWGFAGMEGVADLDGDGIRSEPFPIPGGDNLMELSGGGGSDLGIFRWAGGKMGFAGQMNHDPNYFDWVRRPIDIPPQATAGWRPYPQGFGKLITTGGDMWCAPHQGGATLCAWRVRALLGVPTPQ